MQCDSVRWVCFQSLAIAAVFACGAPSMSPDASRRPSSGSTGQSGKSGNLGTTGSTESTNNSSGDMNDQNGNTSSTGSTGNTGTTGSLDAGDPFATGSGSGTNTGTGTGSGSGSGSGLSNQDSGLGTGLIGRDAGSTAGRDAGATTGGGDDDGGAAGPASWATIYQSIISMRCGPCHTTRAPVAGGLNLSAADMAYTNLVGVAPMGMPCLPRAARGLKRVVPNDPNMSLLFIKVNNGPMLCGMRMPQPGMGRMALTAANIALIRNWIMAGAPNN